jgi:Cyclic nucleotide-binding domain
MTVGSDVAASPAGARVASKAICAHTLRCQASDGNASQNLVLRQDLSDDEPMRHESSVTSLSWIPSEAVTGVARAAFNAGFAHYDDPPPGELGDIEELRAADRFRFANVLRVWIEVGDSGRITGFGYGADSHGLMGSTTIRLGRLQHRFLGVLFRNLQHDPESGEGWVRFVQTAGGRTGVPAPRRVRRRPFVQWQAPTVWTTLSLTLHASGQAEFGITGASRFPRHWVYDGDGQLSRKSGLADFRDWYRKSFGRYSPWGDADSSALTMEVETALERALSVQLMHGGAKPRIERLSAGTTLVRQGQPGTDVYLVLDGVVRVERDGERLAEYGPGALLGERAPLEGGRRTSTVVAVTPCRVAVVDAGELERSALKELSTGHQREGGG